MEGLNVAVDFTDIYECNSFIDEIKKKHIDMDDEPLQMGIFGYFGEVQANILQNSAQTASENSLEALPTKAQFGRNVLTHAYSLGLSAEATPAVMKVVVYLPEDRLEKNLDYTGRFTLDSNFKIMVGEFEFHLDYDIIIRRVTLPNKDTVYTALYDMSRSNPLSDLTSPYIQSVGRFTVNNTRIIAIQTQIRQVAIDRQELTLITSNPLQNKTFQFSFDDQLAGFNIDVKEGDNTYHLNAVYDGLIDNTGSKYLTYLFLDEKTIRCTFKKESYQPRINARITINIYTTKGEEGNFTYTKTIMSDLKSDRFKYNNIWMISKPLTDSQTGEDGNSTEDLKKLIPTEMLARGSVTNTSDLGSFFNSINTDDRRIYFIKKLDSLERLYYSYVAIKQDNNVIPTNTIDIDITRDQFDGISNSNYLLYPGNCIYYRRNINGQVVTSYLNDEEAMKQYRDSGFLYFNPFLMVINKSPFYVSYLINIIDCVRDVTFSYINQNSPLQFIVNDIRWRREYFTDRNTYILSLNMLQNINTNNYDILITTRDESNKEVVVDAKLKVIAILKNKDGTPSRYAYADFVSYNDEDQSFRYDFRFTTDNTMDKDMNLKLLNLYDIHQTYTIDGYFPETTDVDIYILAKLSEDYTGRGIISTYVNGLEGWTCCNMYSIMNGVPMYYNYSKVISTFINISQGTDNSLKYSIKKVPCIKYDYVITEERIRNIVEYLEIVRHYIDFKLVTIEDGFGVDIKLFNTYGPARFFKVENDTQLDNTSISPVFRTKPTPAATEEYLTDITNYIKEYIENFNNLGDLHFANLQSAVYEEFKTQIEFFDFVNFNHYDTSIQHLTREPFETDITKVPELICVNITSKDLPDITIQVMN